MILFLLISTHVAASNFTFTNYSSINGLSSSAVYKVFQDSRGYIWAGTSEGLNRFDGKNFKVFKHSPFDSTSLSDNWVVAIAEDRLGTIWVGTHNGGLNRYNEDKGNFTRFQFSPDNKKSIASNRVWYILNNNDNNLWVCTSGGLNQLDIETGVFQRFTHDPADPQSISSNSVNVVLKDSNNDYWFGTFGGGLNKAVFINGKHRFKNFTNDNSEKGKFLSRIMIKNIAEDKFGFLWLATYKNGLIRLDKSTFDYIQYLPGNSNYSLPQNSVFGLLYDSNGNLWAGTHNEGVCLLTNIGRELKTVPNITIIKHDPLEQVSLSNNSVVDIIEDATGQIWFATDKGLNKYSPGRSVFNHIKVKYGNENSLSGKLVKSLLEDGNGNIWVGTFGGGLNKFNRTTGIFENYSSGGASKIKLSNNTVWVLQEDSPGKLWVGTSYGLNYIDFNTNKNEVFFRGDNESGLSHNNISAMLSIDDKYLWIGTWGGGLNIMDKKKKQFFKYKNNHNNPESLSSNVVKKIFRDSHGRIWIGTFGGGLNLVLTKNASASEGSLTFRHFKYDYTDPNSIGADNITDIFETSNGTLWIATYGGGINKLLTNTDVDSGENVYSFKSFTEKNGLADNTVYRILEDDEGYLWFSTNHGLVKFDPGRETFYTYDMMDGLQDNEFDQAAFKTTKGELLFGGINGFNIFDPAKILTNPVVPKVEITGFTKLDSKLNLVVELNPKSDIKLNYDDYYFSVSFAALDFTRPEKNKYAYKLEGFDKEWIYSQNVTTANYTNISGGDYIFRVKASNNEGVWNETGTSIKFKIATPPWYRWYAFIIYLLVVAAIVYLIVYLVNRENKVILEVRQKELALEREVTEKLRSDEKTREIIYRISEAASKARNLDKLYKAVHNILKEIIFAENIYIALYNDQNDTISFPYFVDEKENLDPEMLKPHKPGKGLTEYVLNNAETLFLTRQQYNELVNNNEVKRLGAGAVEWIGIPLINSRGKAIGVLALQNYSEPRVYNEKHTKLLDFVSRQIVMAIERKFEEDMKLKSDFIFNTSKAHMTLVNRNYEYEAVNEAFCATHGMKRDDILGIKVSDFWGKTKFLSIIKNYLDKGFKGEIVTYQAWFETKTSGLNCYDINYYPYINEDNEVTHIVVVARDITELVKAEENLKKLLRGVEQIDDIIFMTTLEGEITYANSAFGKVYGFSPEEIIGANPSIIKSEKSDGAVYKNLWKTILDGKPFRTEIVNKTKNGEYITVDLSINSVINSMKRITGYIAVQRDISGKKNS